MIDKEGKLRQITVNDLPVGRDVEETLRLVQVGKKNILESGLELQMKFVGQNMSHNFQAFQFTDEHGEVCPAGWRPGKKSMKPNAEGVSEYLANQEAEK